jgi:aryl-alcohol dehydrogenase-like predicted oxidoreductase
MTARPKMKYTKIPYVEKPVSRILFGTAFYSMLIGGDAGELLDRMLELGVTTFDTARGYAKAEISLGNWIESRGIRDKVVILTKGALTSETGEKRVTEKDILDDLAESLENLKTCRDVSSTPGHPGG